jgi:hypothetical protein
MEDSLILRPWRALFTTYPHRVYTPIYFRSIRIKGNVGKENLFGLMPGCEVVFDAYFSYFVSLIEYASGGSFLALRSFVTNPTQRIFTS